MSGNYGYRASDAGATAGWIMLGTVAAVVGFMGRLTARRYRIVRRDNARGNR